MGSENRFDGIDPYAAKLIRYKARQLVRRSEFSQSDQEDIEQEIVLDLLYRLPRYDPRRAQRNTFIARIIEHKVAALIDYRRAAKRDFLREGASLNRDIADGEGRTTDAIQTVDQETYLRRLGIPFRPQRDEVDLRLDLESALQRLPEDLRSLCEMLRSMSVQEIATAVGIPRPSVYDAIKRVKARLVEEGFEEIFRPRPTDRDSRR